MAGDGKWWLACVPGISYLCLCSHLELSSCWVAFKYIQSRGHQYNVITPPHLSGWVVYPPLPRQFCSNRHKLWHGPPSEPQQLIFNFNDKITASNGMLGNRPQGLRWRMGKESWHQFVLDEIVVSTFYKLLYLCLFWLTWVYQTRKLLFSKLAIYLTDDNNFF